MRTHSPITVRAGTLLGIDAFRPLSPAVRDRLASRFSSYRFHPGEFILMGDDRRRHVYFLVSGIAQATIFSDSGRQLTFQELGPGDMFGELAAIDGAPRSAQILAHSECLVLSLPPDEFFRMLAQYPVVTHATLRRMSATVRLLSERLFELSELPVGERVRAEILRIAMRGKRNPAITDRVEIEIDPAPTHYAMANCLATNRESVSRELASLRDLGIIANRRGAWIVHDLHALSQLVATSNPVHSVAPA